MLTSVTVVAPDGAYWPDLTIPLAPAGGEPLALLSIVGLEPVAAAISTRQMASVDGEFHVGSQVGKRNIVFKVGLLTPEARDVVYAYFLPKNGITLRLNFDHRDSVEIYGVVENTPELDRFSESAILPGMQVSLICPKPNFLSPIMLIGGVTGENAFTAPESDLLYSGTSGGGFLLDLDLGVTDYSGGLQIRIHVDGDSTYRTMTFTEYDYTSDGHIRINTNLGERRAEVHYPDEDPISILGYMEDTYFWTQLFAALNKVQVITPESATPRDWTLWYADQFAGV